MGASQTAPGSSQPIKAKQGSADLSLQNLGATAATLTPPRTKNVTGEAKAMAAFEKDVPPFWTCKQCLKMSFFFDGTGNNLESDIGTMEHSNVARLYRAHMLNNPAIGLYSFYVPGIGTYFQDVGDAGGTAGLAFAAGGQARLDWAFKEFDKKVDAAKAPILSIKISVFGFSRGSALARAFCRDLAKRCDPCTSPGGTGFKLKKNGIPIEVYFLGIFDTVASVGIPMGANNASRLSVVKAVSAAAHVAPLALTPVGAAIYSIKDKPELYHLAFGDSGIDPAPGPNNGHLDWGKDLTIQPIVKSCLHMIAGHEVRNSFPVDSAANGGQYPHPVTEMVYPGAHSDVGGGYRPTEEARAPHYGEMLSLIPLRVMYDRACKAGVPLVPFSAFTDIEKKDFAVDKEGAEHFKVVSDHFTHYMNTVGWQGGNLGENMLRHMRMYYRWRFLTIYKNSVAHDHSVKTSEEKTLEKNEAVFSKERAALDEDLEKKRKELQIAESRVRNYDALVTQSKMNHAKFGTPINPKLESDAQDARNKADQAKDAYLRVADKKRTAANDSAIGKAAQRYDEELMEDARAIENWMKADKSLRLRPHFQAMMDAYNEVFGGKGMLLSDEKIIAFFDRYVHDSLAGFDTDKTRRSDPRVVYIGGDRKLLDVKQDKSESKAGSVANAKTPAMHA